jgi:hypothetical protein
VPTLSNRILSPCLAAIAVLVLVAWPASGQAHSTRPTSGQSAPWPGNPFSPTSVWNASLSRRAPINRQSRVLARELVSQVRTYGSWMNTQSYSTPVYVVGANAQTQRVNLSTWGPDLQQAFDAVPIPADAQSSTGTDEQMTVWQPSTNKLWEFWKLRHGPDGWQATWGGEMDNVSSSPGYFTHTGQTSDWGATATGLPLLGGLVTVADLRRGRINHALAIAVVETSPRRWAWPAQRTDGDAATSPATAIPAGTRFRLDPALNINRLHLPRIDRMLATAAQKYGIVVRDTAGAVAFYGQDPTASPANPWSTAFGDRSPSNVLALFPWGHLKVLWSNLS